MCWFLLAPMVVFAGDKGLQKSKIAIGGYSLIRSDVSLSLTEPLTGLGVSINPEDTLGVRSEQTVFRLEGYYRFNTKHKITYSWYRISSNGNKSLEKEIEWVDEEGNSIIIPIGTQVSTQLGYDIYKVGYLWSFYNNDKVDMAIGAGMHATRFAVALEAEKTGSRIEARDAKLTVPLPVLSFSFAYQITPKFSCNYSTELFFLGYETFKGRYVDNSLGMEFRAFKNVSLGVGLGSSNLDVFEENGAYKLAFKNQITGIKFYIATYF